jgi:hypothetical protein
MDLEIKSMIALQALQALQVLHVTLRQPTALQALHSGAPLKGFPEV